MNALSDDIRSSRLPLYLSFDVTSMILNLQENAITAFDRLSRTNFRVLELKFLEGWLANDEAS